MTTPIAPDTFDERSRGFEFDWFAQDAEGHVALFSTGGFAPVPSQVQAHYQDHDRAASSLEVPHWGSPNLWKDYARQGLYVFDWVPNVGPYRRLEQPEGEIPAALQHLLLPIMDLPRFTGLFRLVGDITVSEEGMASV